MSLSSLSPRTAFRVLLLASALLLLAMSAQAQPTLSKVFTPDEIGPGSVSTITFTITNGGAIPVTGLSFTDVLPVVPSAMTIADPANASTSCDLTGGGTLSAPDGGSTITLTDARIGAFQSCTVTVDVTASTPGIYTNPAITLSSSAGSSMSLPVDLTVATDLPGFSKSFAPSSVSVGGRSTLTFTIDNTLNALRVGNLDFIDNLPAGMVVADPSNASTDCVSASLANTTLLATPGSNQIILDASGNATFPGFEVLPAGATCTVVVDVTTTGAGMLDNVTNELLADFSSAGRASSTLASSITPIALTKSFTDDPVPPGNTATLEFTITNFDRNFPATGVTFTDDLGTLVPALPGLTFGTELFNDCGPMVTGLGTATLSFSGGTIPAEGVCTIRVDLPIPSGATPGGYVNSTSTVSGNVDGSPVVGNVATDTLFVEPVPILTKEFLAVGTLDPDPVVRPGDDVVLRFTVTNTSTTSAATDIEFLDELTDSGPGTGFLPFPISVVSPSLPTAACGGSLAVVFLDTDRQALNLTGGSLSAAPGAGATCTIDVTLNIPAGLAPGLYMNTTGNVTATVDGETRLGNQASDTLTVIAAPRLTKEFTDDPVAPGGSVTLEFALSHPVEATSDATDISFTDDLDAMGIAGLTVNLPPSPDPPCGMGSSLTAPGNVLTLDSGFLQPGQDCTFSVTLDIPAPTAPGNYINSTSVVDAMVQGLAATSSAVSDTLNVSGLTFTKEFLGDPVIAGDFVTLRFTIANIHPSDDATGIFFTDSLADVLPGVPDLVATLPPATDTCGGMMGGPTFLIYTGGSVLSGATCVIELDVLVPAGTADGGYANITSSLSATQGGGVTVDPATDVLEVDSTRLQLTKSFTDDPVAAGDSVTLEFTLTNLDPSSAASNFAFTDDLDAALDDLTFDSVLLDTCGGIVAGTTTTLVDVSGVSLAAGASCVLRLSLSVPGAAAEGVYLNTTSSLSGTVGGLSVTGAPASDELDVVALLLFSKSFDGPTTATGAATLTFTITNPGNATATNIDFSDDLDAVISGLIATSLPAQPCGAGSSISGISFLTFTGGELPPMGGTCSFDVDVLVPASATAGTYLNSTSQLFRNGLVVSDPATANLVIEPPPTFAKVFAPDVIFADGVSTLTFSIDNSASALAADNLDFTDNLPAGVVVASPPNVSNTCGGTLSAIAGAGTISLTGSGSVGAGATCTIEVDVTSIVSGAHVNTTGDLTSTSGNSGTASDTLTVASTADLSVTKTDGVTTATPGGSVVYTIVVSNAGPSADPSVALADTFPSPPLTCTYTSVAAGGASGNTAAGAGNLSETLSMPAGSSVTYTATCDIDSDATGTLSNTATVTPSVNDMVPGNNSATDGDTVLVPSADLAITKTDGVTSAVPGQTTLTYTIVASNAGLSDDPSVSVTDTFPASLTCSFTSVAAGGATGNTAAGAGDLSESLSLPAASSVTYTVSCTIDPAATGTLSNTATISGSVDDPNTGNNSATDDDTVLSPEADLSVTKTDGITSAVPGQTGVTYTIVVTNNGPSADPAASLTDVFPASLFCSTTSVASGGATGNTSGLGDLDETLSMPVGSSVTYTSSCSIDSAATGTLSNTATVTASVTDPVPGNNSATDDDTVLTPEVDLSMEKSTEVSVVAVGDSIVYELTVNNSGPSTATGVMIDDPTPTGLVFESADAPCGAGFPCALADLGPEDTVVIAVTFMVPFDYASPAQITNTATVSTDTPDNDSGNDSDTVVTDVAFDTEAPVVSAIQTTNGLLGTCDDLRQPVSSIAVTIEDEGSPIVGADDPANYLLVGSGPDGDFSTSSCAGGALGDDEVVTITNVAVDDTDPQSVIASLTVAGPNGLAAGLYRFFVCDTIADEAGNTLAADVEVAFFRANPRNLFVNGHFDDCPSTLDPWVVDATPVNTVQTGVAGVDDFAGSPLSTSAHFVQSQVEVSGLSQCVGVAGGTLYDLESWFRYDAPMGALAAYEQTCEFFDAAECLGTSLGETTVSSLLEDVGPTWFFSESTFTAPVGAASAACRFETGPLGGDPLFNLYLDALFLGGSSNPEIFSDGFESGDTSAWSATIQ